MVYCQLKSMTCRWCWWNCADNQKWSAQFPSQALETWTFVTLILTLLPWWVCALYVWLKGHAGLPDLIFSSVSQHTIRQSAACDPCNLNIASEQYVGFCWWGTVCDLMLSFSSTCIYCTHAVYTEIHMVPQDRKKYRHSSTFKEITVLLHDDKSPSQLGWTDKMCCWRSE